MSPFYFFQEVLIRQEHLNDIFQLVHRENKQIPSEDVAGIKKGRHFSRRSWGGTEGDIKRAAGNLINSEMGVYFGNYAVESTFIYRLTPKNFSK